MTPGDPNRTKRPIHSLIGTLASREAWPYRRNALTAMMGLLALYAVTSVEPGTHAPENDPSTVPIREMAKTSRIGTDAVQRVERSSAGTRSPDVEKTPPIRAVFLRPQVVPVGRVTLPALGYA
jgi:hypothetical protein